MISFIRFLLVSLLLLASTSTFAAPLHGRDVVDPPVTDPNASTIWTVGSTQLVVWDTSKLPPYNQITNKVGTVVLGFSDSNGENLMLDNPLAKGFNITQGSVQVVVPNVPARSNYIIVLMGDSGNASPMFKIISNSPNPDGNSPSSSTTTDTDVPIPSPPPSNKGSSTGETSTESEPSTTAPDSGLSPTTSGSSTNTPGGNTPTPASYSSSTIVTTSTSSAALQATATKKSSGAMPSHRAGATYFAAVLLLTSLLL